MPIVENEALGPELKTRVPGPESRTWLLRLSRVAAPMGPIPEPGPMRSIVFARGSGSNVWDVDGNRFVDLAAGFGSLLLGHDPPEVLRALDVQKALLLQAMGDVYPSNAKVGLLEQLVEICGIPDAQGILGQSGADAVSAALKTAVLATGRAGVIAFRGAYHGLSYGPLSVCGLRESYREPFAAQLNSHVHWVDYPKDTSTEAAALERTEALLRSGGIGALIYEPILGRGGVVPMSDACAKELRRLTIDHGALLIADEIWTGLGRSGSWLYCGRQGVTPDVVCLGKGLGGGLPLSACLARREVMQAWSRDAEVVHTSTFAGAPLACATALATLDVLRRGAVVERAAAVGSVFMQQLRDELGPLGVTLSGAGLMIGAQLDGGAGVAGDVLLQLAKRGYLVSTGGGARQSIVLTPPLTIAPSVLTEFTSVFRDVLRGTLHGG